MTYKFGFMIWVLSPLGCSKCADLQISIGKFRMSESLQWARVQNLTGIVALFFFFLSVNEFLNTLLVLKFL